jgi:hypothetical protein
MSDVLLMIGGIILLVAGRKLYWLFVGLIGFAAGLALTSLFVNMESEALQWLIAIGLGILGGLLAVGLQKVAVGAAGFIAGGYGLVYFLEILGLEAGNLDWIFFIGGGIAGLVLILALFDFALILLSSLAGATLVSQAVNFTDWQVTAVFLGLVLLGVLIQLVALRAEDKTG